MEEGIRSGWGCEFLHAETPFMIISQHSCAFHIAVGVCPVCAKCQSMCATQPLFLEDYMRPMLLDELCKSCGIALNAAGKVTLYAMLKDWNRGYDLIVTHWKC